MLQHPLIPQLPFLGLFLATSFLLLLAFYGGIRFGRWIGRKPDPEPQIPARTIISGVLSLLAFVLGFTFGLSSSHFDAREVALNDEAIDILTAYRRADLLTEPGRTRVQTLLRKYVDLRLESGGTSGNEEIADRLRKLQKEIWEAAIDAGKTSGQPTPTILFQSLNEVIDVDGERILEHMRSRIPTGVWYVLYGITIVAVAGTGYHSGLAGGRRSIAAVVYAVVFAAVIAMTADQDIPSRGRLETDHHALQNLQIRLKGFDP